MSLQIRDLKGIVKFIESLREVGLKAAEFVMVGIWKCGASKFLSFVYSSISSKGYGFAIDFIKFNKDYSKLKKSYKRYLSEDPA